MNKSRRIPTCNQCGKNFKTTQGLGGHRVLYHRLDANREGESSSTLNQDSEYVETIVNKVTSIETKVKDLQSKMTSKNYLPIGLLCLAVCPKCGLVLKFDKAFRKGNWVEDAHFDCPKCGSVNEVIELISRRTLTAKSYADMPEDEAEDAEDAEV